MSFKLIGNGVVEIVLVDFNDVDVEDKVGEDDDDDVEDKVGDAVVVVEDNKVDESRESSDDMMVISEMRSCHT